jgi:hypothetical protein
MNCTNAAEVMMGQSARRFRWIRTFVATGSLLAGTPVVGNAQQPPLQGGVQQNTSPSPGNSAGPTTTNQPGGSTDTAACKQIDAECGGTSRLCYNEMYHTTGIVISTRKSQALYAQTQGQIWYRCGACGTDKVICYPRPGYEKFGASGSGANTPAHAATASSGTVNAPPPPTPHPFDDTMRNVAANCAMRARQGANAQNCGGSNLQDYCRRSNDPNCIGIIADNPTINVRNAPGTRVENGQIIIPGGAEQLQQAGSTAPNGMPATASAPRPGAGQVIVGKVAGHYDPKRPYYNGQLPNIWDTSTREKEHLVGWGSYTIDVSKEPSIAPERHITNPLNPAKEILGTVVAQFDDEKNLLWMMLTVNGKQVQLLPSNKPGATLQEFKQF